VGFVKKCKVYARKRLGQSASRRIITQKQSPEESAVPDPPVSMRRVRPKYLDWLKKIAPPNYNYDNDHFKQIAVMVDRTVTGEIDRVRIHMPPGHAKTETVTWRLPVYIWQEIDPKAKILITCYSQDYAKELGWQIRELAIENGIPIREDSRAKDQFKTAWGGALRACGVGATPTGRRFNVIIGDDPIKDRAQVESPVFRKKLSQWWSQGIMSRLLPGGLVFLVFTRWHEDDLGGRLDAKEAVGGDKYEKLILRAIENEGQEDERALWPDVYPISLLKRIRRNTIDDEGLRGWEALYQQNPNPAEGDTFKIGALTFIHHEQVPIGLKRVRRWDLAASLNGDYTAGVLMAGPCAEGKFYVLNVKRGRWSVGERDRIIRQTAEEDGYETTVVGPIDPGAAGVQASEAFVRLLAGFTVEVERESGSKEVRAGPLASQVENGNVVLVNGSYTTDFIEELRNFPNGKHDDQVDAAAGAFNWLPKTYETFAGGAMQRRFGGGRGRSVL
jgi:predicted phage terminase large subunit-like protein